MLSKCVDAATVGSSAVNVDACAIAGPVASATVLCANSVATVVSVCVCETMDDEVCVVDVSVVALNCVGAVVDTMCVANTSIKGDVLCIDTIRGGAVVDSAAAAVLAC